MSSTHKESGGSATISSNAVDVAVIIATLGRPEVVTQTLRRILDNQTLKPSTVIVSCSKIEDAGDTVSWPEVVVCVAPPGLAAQRNKALSAISSKIEIVVFFDDDFVPERRWLEIAASQFRDMPDIVGFTGNVIADGIKGPGFSFDYADRLINEVSQVSRPRFLKPYSPYGCNMAFRLSAINELRFDERLVLYGWLEDRDFGAALAAKGGRLVKCSAALGVHLGVKSGRIAGERLGYSQIINPLYLMTKGTMTRKQAISQIVRNVASNITGWFFPEKFVDRRGRLRGNLHGTADALKGCLEPERALQIQTRRVD